MLPNIKTSRLFIRPYAANEALQRNELMRLAFGLDETLKATRDWLEWMRLSYTQFARHHQPPYGDYAVALQSDGTVVGSVGIVPALIPWSVFERPPQHDLDYTTTPEFGLFWAILPAHQKRGYATEAARALTAHLYHTLQIARVVATTEYDNQASIRVMQNIGMTIQHNPHRIPAWFHVVGKLNSADSFFGA